MGFSLTSRQLNSWGAALNLNITVYCERRFRPISHSWCRTMSSPRWGYSHVQLFFQQCYSLSICNKSNFQVVSSDSWLKAAATPAWQTPLNAACIQCTPLIMALYFSCQCSFAASLLLLVMEYIYYTPTSTCGLWLYHPPPDLLPYSLSLAWCFIKQQTWMLCIFYICIIIINSTWFDWIKVDVWQLLSIKGHFE